MCEHVNWDVRIDLDYFCTLLCETKVIPLTMEVPDLIKIGEILKKMLVGCCLKKRLNRKWPQDLGVLQFIGQLLKSRAKHELT